MHSPSFGLAKWIEQKQAEQTNSAQQEIYTALMEIDGVSVLLHFDEVRRVWFDPQRPEVTYPEQADPEDRWRSACSTRSPGRIPR